MPLTEFIAQQLRKPSGWFGRWIMARLLNRINQPINTQTLDLLAVQPDDRVLEVGFGGGDLIGRIADRAAAGFVAGVDFSPDMVNRCAGRYRALVEAGRMALRCADAETLPFQDDHFTKACTVNTLYFWDDPASVLNEFRRVLIEDGLLVVGFSPKRELEKKLFAAHGFTLYDEEAVRHLMEAAGFDTVQIMPGQVGRHTFFCAVGAKGRHTVANTWL